VPDTHPDEPPRPDGRDPWHADPHLAPEFDRAALVVVDVQVDFLDGGSSPVPGTRAVVPVIGRLVEGFRRARRPVVHVVRLYDGDDVDLSRRTLIASGASVVRPGSPGSQIAPGLRPPGAPPLDAPQLLSGDLQQLAPDEWAMWKPRWDAFHRTDLDRHLRDLAVSTVVVAGCNFPNCPRATLYGASQRDYRTVLASDAVSGVLPLHLAEAERIGVLHARSGAIASRLGSAPPGRAGAVSGRA
jgi:nicotinamidase-related amidase